MRPAGAATGRRSFLSWFLGTSVGALCASVIYPVTRYLIPPDIPEASTSRASAGPAEELRPNQGKIFRFGGRPGLLVRTEDGTFRAYDATCSHLNCTVQYRSDLKQIWCACHNGVYDLNGQNVSGPPPRPLTEFTVHVADGDVIVSRG